MENLIDDDLRDLLGDRYQGEAVKTSVAGHKNMPEGRCADAQHMNPIPRLIASVKWPVFFLSLGTFIGWSGNMDLMEEIISVPGMCICSACFGWHIKK